MRSKDVVGKRIVKVQQARCGNVVSIDALILEDGTVIYFSAYQTDDAPVPTATVIKATTTRT